MAKKKEGSTLISLLSKSDEERIRIIDYLFSSRSPVKVLSASMLRDMVNQRVQQAKPLSSDIAIRKLITVIRAKAMEDGVDISSPHARTLTGYKYTQEGYSIFGDEYDQNQAERDLLRFSASLFNKFKGSELYEELQDIVSKVLQDGGSDSIMHDKRVEKVLHVHSSASTRGLKWIKPLLNAILQRKAVKILYEGYGKNEKVKRICPYVLKEYLGRWYMVAYDYNCDRIHKTNVFMLDCINDIQAANQPYFVDPEFNADQYFRYSLGVWHQHNKNPIKVRLEFREPQDMDQIRHEPLHPSQVIIRSGNRESLQVEIEVYETPELYRLLLGFGARVHVLSPQRVVEQLKMYLKAALDIYR